MQAVLEATNLASIESALSGFMGKGQDTDGCLYIMLAGHGKVDGSGGSVYCCHDYSDESSFTASIALDAVRSMAKRINVKHVVFHLDCARAAWRQETRPGVCSTFRLFMSVLSCRYYRPRALDQNPRALCFR